MAWKNSMSREFIHPFNSKVTKALFISSMYYNWKSNIFANSYVTKSLISRLSKFVCQ